MKWDGVEENKYDPNHIDQLYKDNLKFIVKSKIGHKLSDEEINTFFVEFANNSPIFENEDPKTT